ncbi:hypothetical protein [Rhizobacter sp. Root1221]|uniref:hypothetical protein n=1 Tax=Rhizobacter sp. Root1221 TaxID=1736433 RepID=UPI0012FC1D5D|nr:hypothetical protein [Rhizobacter sp. Root1221]
MKPIIALLLAGLFFLLPGSILVSRYWLTPTERMMKSVLDGGDPLKYLSAKDLLPDGSRAEGWVLVCVRGPFEGLFTGYARGVAAISSASSLVEALAEINADLGRQDPVNAEGEWEIIFGSRNSVKKMVIDSHQVAFQTPVEKCVTYEDAILTRASLSGYPFGTGITLKQR